MKSLIPSLLWAGLILAAACLSAWLNLSEAESFSITVALSGAAVATLPGSQRSCRKARA